MTLKQKVEIITQIVARAATISNTTKHDISTDYSPHVDAVHIYFHKGGWKIGASASVHTDVGFNEWNDTEAQLNELNALFDEYENEAEA